MSVTRGVRYALRYVFRRKVSDVLLQHELIYAFFLVLRAPLGDAIRALNQLVHVPARVRMQPRQRLWDPLVARGCQGLRYLERRGRYGYGCSAWDDALWTR